VTGFKIDGRSFYLKSKLEKVGKGLFKALKIEKVCSYNSQRRI